MDNNNNNQQNQPQQASLSFTNPAVALGEYANLAVITHSPSEVVLDFVRTLPGLEHPAVCSRVVMTPENAKRLMLSLQENIKGYEQTFGPIQFPEDKIQQPAGGRTIAPFGDGTTKGEA